MSDRQFFSVIGLAAAAMILLALVWPQGLGARSPWPFGHRTVAQTSGPAVPHPATVAKLKGAL